MCYLKRILALTLHEHQVALSGEANWKTKAVDWSGQATSLQAASGRAVSEYYCDTVRHLQALACICTSTGLAEYPAATPGEGSTGSRKRKFADWFAQATSVQAAAGRAAFEHQRDAEKHLLDALGLQPGAVEIAFALIQVCSRGPHALSSRPLKMPVKVTFWAQLDCP